MLPSLIRISVKNRDKYQVISRTLLDCTKTGYGLMEFDKGNNLIF